MFSLFVLLLATLLCYHLRLPDPLPFKKSEKQLLLATQSAETGIDGLENAFGAAAGI
jgi:hypothetical protein